MTIDFHVREALMARACRTATAYAVHHVYNRGNRKKPIFHKWGDYRAFYKLLQEASAKFGMRVLAFCIMKNHWHLVLWPADEESLSDFMHWLTSTHVRRYHAHYGLTGTGHLYQDRYKNRICKDERGVLAVMRYVEANALSAKYVKRAEDWEWSSLRVRLRGDPGRLLSEGPVPLPENWTAFVNETRPEHREEALRACEDTKEGERRRKRDARKGADSGPGKPAETAPQTTDRRSR